MTNHQNKIRQSQQIDNIIKDTIKKNAEEKKNKVKEIELKKETYELFKKKLEDLNDGIRKANQSKLDKLRSKLKQEKDEQIQTEEIDFSEIKMIPVSEDQQITIQAIAKSKKRKAETPSPFKKSLRQK